MQCFKVPLVLLACVGITASCEVESQLEHLRGVLEVSPQEISFGEVYLGASREIPLALVNSGTAPVEVWLEIEGGEGAFRIGSFATVAAGGKTLVPVHYDVLREGAVAAVLTLSSADSSFAVPLNGVGLAWPDCATENPCTSSRFDPGEGRCLLTDLSGSCDDANACTEHDRCVAGHCVGQRIRCADQTDCTQDVCDPVQGCLAIPDHELCADDDPCSSDICDPELGCRYEPAEGAPCGEQTCQHMGICIAGQCRLRPTPDNSPCDDGNICTVNDRCLMGECVPGPGSTGENFGPLAVTLDAHDGSTFGEVLAVGPALEEDTFVVVYHSKVLPNRGDCDDENGCCSHWGGQVHYATFSNTGEQLSDLALSYFAPLRPSHARATLHRGELYLLGYEPAEFGDGCAQERTWLYHYSPQFGADRVTLPQIASFNPEEMAIAVSLAQSPGSIVTARVSHRPSHSYQEPTTVHLRRWDQWLDNPEDRTLVLWERGEASLPVRGLHLVARAGVFDLAYLLPDGSGCSDSCDSACVQWCSYQAAHLSTNVFGEGPTGQIVLANEVQSFSAVAPTEVHGPMGAFIIDSAVDGNTCCPGPHESVRLMLGSVGGIMGQTTVVEHSNGRTFAQVSPISALGQEGALLLGFDGTLQAALTASRLTPPSAVDLSFGSQGEWIWDPGSPMQTTTLGGQLVAAARVSSGWRWGPNSGVSTPPDYTLGLVGLGCGPPDSRGEVETRFDRFTGVWMVDQPFHALYEATHYRFFENGTLRMVTTFSYDELNPTAVTGTVYHPDTEVDCWFGDRWHSPNSATLAITGHCSDGLEREIVLGFRADPLGDMDNAYGFIISVDGEFDWIHNDFEWRFSRVE